MNLTKLHAMSFVRRICLSLALLLFADATSLSPVFAVDHEELYGSSSASFNGEQAVGEPFEFARNLLRGPRPPTEMELRQWVKKNGITTILSVDDYYDEEDMALWESVWAKGVGVKFIHYPIHHYAGPSLEQLTEALNLMVANPDERVFLHCKYGKDRTGLVVAAYRMRFENMSVEDAVDELYAFGHSSWLFFWDSVLNDFRATIHRR